eukprot:gene17597-biopygen8528
MRSAHSAALCEIAVLHVLCVAPRCSAALRGAPRRSAYSAALRVLRGAPRRSALSMLPSAAALGTFGVALGVFGVGVEYHGERGAPRSAAEYAERRGVRGAPRSAAERRGAPRSDAEYVEYCDFTECRGVCGAH